MEKILGKLKRARNTYLRMIDSGDRWKICDAFYDDILYLNEGGRKQLLEYFKKLADLNQTAIQFKCPFTEPVYALDPHEFQSCQHDAIGCIMYHDSLPIQANENCPIRDGCMAFNAINHALVQIGTLFSNAVKIIEDKLDIGEDDE